MRPPYSFLLSMTSLAVLMSCAIASGDRPTGNDANPYGRVRLKGDQLINYTLPGDDHFCDSRACFDDYLATVFSYCGTRTLAKQLVPAPSFNHINAEDVLIRGGYCQ